MNYNKLNDDQLVEQLRLENELAFKHLYNRFWEKMYFVAVKKINDIHEAEEIIQDIFSNLWKRRHTLQVRTNLESYLAGALKYEVFKRRALRTKRSFISNHPDVAYLPLEDHSRNLFDNRILEEELLNTINSLPPKCKLVFNMSRSGGLSNKQIAEELAISEKAVEKHITSALKIIKSHFGRFFYLLLLLKGWI